MRVFELTVMYSHCFLQTVAVRSTDHTRSPTGAAIQHYGLVHTRQCYPGVQAHTVRHTQGRLMRVCLMTLDDDIQLLNCII